MLVQLDFKSSVPLYQQLKTGIIAGILSGDLREDDRLPSIRQLAGDLGINLHTVRKVYGLLADEGYVHYSRSLGTVVNAPPALDSEGMEQFEAVLLPIIIELRARNVDKADYDALMGHLWETSIEASSAESSVGELSSEPSQESVDKGADVKVRTDLFPKRQSKQMPIRRVRFS